MEGGIDQVFCLVESQMVIFNFEEAYLMTFQKNYNPRQ